MKKTWNTGNLKQSKNVVAKNGVVCIQTPWVYGHNRLTGKYNGKIPE